MAKAKKRSSSSKSAPQASSIIPIHPLGDRVLVKPLSAEEMGTKTASGIIIPDSVKKESKEGKVIAVGSGKYEEGMKLPMTVKVGDRVLFRQPYDSDVDIHGVKHFIVSEDDILAIVK